MGLSINDSVYSCVFFFLTGLHFFHLVVGLLLLSLLSWSCSFSFSGTNSKEDSNSPSHGIFSERKWEPWKGEENKNAIKRKKKIQKLRPLQLLVSLLFHSVHRFTSPGVKRIAGKCLRNRFSCLTPGLDWTRLFMSLTAGAGTRCMSLWDASVNQRKIHESWTSPRGVNRFLPGRFSWQKRKSWKKPQRLDGS